MNESLATSTQHRYFALIGFGFLWFEFFFLIFYADNFWFSFNVGWTGLPLMLLSIGLAHLSLCFWSSKFTCRWFSFMFKGRPPVIYRHWLDLDESGITFGLRHIRYEVIDELALTFFGNLLIRSRALCGAKCVEADLILKLPLGVATQQAQIKLIETIQSRRPGVVINTRLQKRLTSKILKGQEIVQMLGVVMMALVLFDVGQSSFYYLRMLRHYHLALLAALDGKAAGAQAELSSGDDLLRTPFPFSYVTNRFISVGASAAGLREQRARILWSLGKHEEAIAEAKKAIELDANHFRFNLLLARFLAAEGRTDEARKEIEEAEKKHKHSLLTQLYFLATVKQGDPAAIGDSYQKVVDKFTEEVFVDEPRWPPGGNTYLHDVFYSDDLYFILDRLLDKGAKGNVRVQITGPAN